MDHPRIIAIIDTIEDVDACLNAAVAAAAAFENVIVEAFYETTCAESAIEFDGATHPSASHNCPDLDFRQMIDDWRASRPDAPPIHYRATQTGTRSCWIDEAHSAVVTVITAIAGAENDDFFRAALFETGKPVLWVPSKWKPGPAGFAHVAIGVERDRAEQAAGFAAGPWLCAARRGTAIRIGPLDLSHEEPAREELYDGPVLEWHLVDRSPEMALGNQLANEALSIGADLLVCGAYRFSGVIERLLGGTTHHLLQTTQVPILLAHRL